MGIKGLHSELVAASTSFELGELRNQTVCVDGHGWLHRGAIGCARQLAECVPTRQYAEFVVDRVKLLATYGVRCIVVFDGRELPAKRETHRLRDLKRASSLEAARACVDTERANKLYAQTVRVTPEMVKRTIDSIETARVGARGPLRAVRTVVAPYEADPQLVALCIAGEADGIISEDSDIFAYMAACQLHYTPLVMQLDASGSGLAIWGARPEVFCRGSRGSARFRGALRGILDLGDRGGRMFVQACVLVGCDYIDGATGVGPVTAAENVLNMRHCQDHDERLVRLAKRLAPSTDGFAAAARRAEAAFYHAWVWNRGRKCVSLSDLLGTNANCPNAKGDPEIVGAPIAYHHLNPHDVAQTLPAAKCRMTDYVDLHPAVPRPSSPNATPSTIRAEFQELIHSSPKNDGRKVAARYRRDTVENSAKRIRSYTTQPRRTQSRAKTLPARPSRDHPDLLHYFRIVPKSSG